MLKNCLAFWRERREGADASRRAAGDAVTSARSGSAADARPLPCLAIGPGGRQQNVNVIY